LTHFFFLFCSVFFLSDKLYPRVVPVRLFFTRILDSRDTFLLIKMYNLQYKVRFQKETIYFEELRSMLNRISLINSRILSIILMACSQLTLIFIVITEAKDTKKINMSTENFTPFAVVELFTSQGCSSCPPADRFLKKLIQSSKESGKPVYALSFHVDYWNYLGWKDPYSQPPFSERQRRYAQTFGLRGIYTPQMIVNGQDEFVGSREETAKSIIQKALTQKAVCQIAINKIVRNDESIAVRYEVSGDLNNAVLNLALVQKDSETDVKRGENGGRRLESVNIVRDFLSIELTEELSGTQQLKLPKNIDPDQLSVIAFVQDGATMKILGAFSQTIL